MYRHIDLPNEVIEVDLFVDERNFGTIKATLAKNNICFRWGTNHKTKQNIKNNENYQNHQNKSAH